MTRPRFINEGKPPLLVEHAGRRGREQNAEALRSLCRGEGRETLAGLLLKVGAVLLRGFGPLEPAEFGRFVRDFSGRLPLDYVGGASPRVKVCEGVYTSTEYPRHYTLSLHNELSYNYRWPEHLYFYCDTPAAEGGETPLADSRVLLGKIDAGVVARFRKKGVRYDRRLHGGAGVGLSWQEAFETDDRRSVEEYCREGNVSYVWGEDNGLHMSQVRPATQTHPLTGEEVWFNQADAFHTSGMHPETYRDYISRMSEEEFPLGACHGDGSAIDPAALAHVREVMAAEMSLFTWQAGDLLVVDNVLAAHGRMPFSGARRVLLAMT
jgi:alpha-ketoglutarate-dependent taurine dioxygenase